VTLIRPAPGCTPERLLYCGPRDLVAVVRGTGCSLAYDATSSRALDEDGLIALSPFALLDDSDSGLGADLERIVLDVSAQRVANDHTGIPSDGSLVDALVSPNTWTRSAARRIAEAGGAATYPEAVRRIAAEPK